MSQEGEQRQGMYGALKNMAYTRSLQCLDLIRIRQGLGYDILWVDMIDSEKQEFLSDSYNPGDETGYLLFLEEYF